MWGSIPARNRWGGKGPGDIITNVVSVPYPVVLASASPRRRDLLSTLVSEFSIDAPDVDEESLTCDDPEQTARRLAREKCLAVAQRHQGSLVIGSDTVVAIQIDGALTQLAKPADKADARRMLGLLSGRRHTVTTAVFIKWPAGFNSLAVSSEVTFAPMSAEEIEAYVESGEPMDKAGAYGLQGGARPFVSEVRGSVNNVIGLPTEALEEALREIQGAQTTR